jgi:hypothetical protein
MKKLFSISNNVAMIMEDYSKKNGVTQSNVVECALQFYIEKMAGSKVFKNVPDRPLKGQMNINQMR